MEYPENKEMLHNLLEKHCAQLAEHFDSVRIIATSRGDGSDISHSYGAGNWFAQYGSVKDWVTREEEDSRLRLRAIREEE